MKATVFGREGVVSSFLSANGQLRDLIDHLRVTLPDLSINVQFKNIPRNILYRSNLGRVECIDYDAL